YGAPRFPRPRSPSLWAAAPGRRGPARSRTWRGTFGLHRRPLASANRPAAATQAPAGPRPRRARRRSVRSTVEPGVFHAPQIVGAVDPHGDAFDIGVLAGHLLGVPDDRPAGVLGQAAFDLPDDLAAFFRVAFDRLLVDQRVGLLVTVAGII